MNEPIICSRCNNPHPAMEILGKVGEPPHYTCLDCIDSLKLENARLKTACELVLLFLDQDNVGTTLEWIHKIESILGKQPLINTYTSRTNLCNAIRAALKGERE